MGKMILNGTEYSGGAEVTFANGLFIDADNVVCDTFTFDGTEHTWTATADCILTDNMYPPDGSTAYFIRIDGKQVFAGYSTVEDPFVYVRKGQVVTYRAKSGSSMKAYGVQPASNVTIIPDYASACYSSQEREVGCWTDGKPLYQITIDQTIGSDADYTVFANGIENAHLVNAKCEYSSGRWMSANYPSIGSLSSSKFCYVEVLNGALKLHNQANQSTHWIATIQYTKTADIAGSGNWTPLGKPTVHYSTEEQVIGTWIDGKPLYEKTLHIVEGTEQTTKIYTTEIIDLNAEYIKLESAEVKFGAMGGNAWYTAPFYDSGSYNMTVGVSKTQMTITSNGWKYTEANVTVRYTKTTD